MTRPFRLEEDERRYFALRSEFFIRLVQSGVPAQTIHDIMRNFGKLEDAMFFEGLRQGMAVAAVATRTDRDLDPVSFHADLYGDAATPLVRVEEAILGDTTSTSSLDEEEPSEEIKAQCRMLSEVAPDVEDGDEEKEDVYEFWVDLFRAHGRAVLAADEVRQRAELKGHAWLRRDPMEFGPLTINEAIEKYGPDLVVKRGPERPREAVAAPSPRGLGDDQSSMTPEAEAEAERLLEALANGADPEEIFGKLPAARDLQPLIEIPPEDDGTYEPVHKPELLDRVREVLVNVRSKPATWQEMILLLMRELRVDAGHLDDVLSTPMGMTVISQAELFHLHPGAMPEIKPVPRPT